MDARRQRPQQTGRDHRTGVGLVDEARTSDAPATLAGQARLLLPILIVVFVAALDLTVVAPILPTVIFDLRINTIDADRYAWIVLSYLVAYTVTVPLTGRLSDFVGRIPVFLAALMLFLVGSLLAAQATTLASMVVARTLQGLGGGAMLPISMALVADVVPVRRRAAALGLVAAVDTFGWVLGPVWGSGIYALFDSWRAIFWLNLPLGVAAGALLLVAPVRGLARVRGARPNITNTVVGAVFLTTFSLALSTGGEAGLSANQGTTALGGSANPIAAYRWPLLALAVVSGIILVALERRSTNPVLPRRLIASRIFQVAGAANALVGAALIVTMVNAPLAVALLQDEDLVPRDSALLLGSFTLAMTLGAFCGGRLVDRWTARFVAMLGLVVAVLGFTAMHWWPDTLRLGVMSATAAIAGLGLGIVIAPIGETAIRQAGRESYGAASGLVLLARLVGMTVGLAGITAFTLERVNANVAALPSLPTIEGESATQYFERQQEYLSDVVVPLTLDVIRETFLVAGAICVVALLVVWWMDDRRHRPAASRDAE